jgi:putative ABC transport system substrate-binding protein
MRRIGYLFGGTRVIQQRFMDAFVDRLRMLGWIKDENLTIEFRIAESHNEVLPELAAELVQLPVEVIVAIGALAVEPAQRATSTIPIVMVFGPEPTAPTATGIVQRLARPGGNATGTVSGLDTWSSKPVELLKTLLPHLSRLAILTDTSTPADLKEDRAIAGCGGSESQAGVA